ncbi:unnamed protein product [Trypanosoma congolense IL3000]|uniref:WGS project CAEQ00000000 data, annotated contig 1421 n=1 Tax=Trypanosoma congolense (strain IL3000) TaxID=1068625 RepID=F9W640_TRYCI|nr:unnamed protein product [Trypanosoma congolense IL3000]
MVSSRFAFIAPSAICSCAFTLSCKFHNKVVGSFFPLASNILPGACSIPTDSTSNQTDKYPSSSSHKYRPYSSRISTPSTRAHPFRYAPHSQLPVKLLLPMEGSPMRLDKRCVSAMKRSILCSRFPSNLLDIRPSHPNGRTYYHREAACHPSEH